MSLTLHTGNALDDSLVTLPYRIRNSIRPDRAENFVGSLRVHTRVYQVSVKKMNSYQFTDDGNTEKQSRKYDDRKRKLLYQFSVNS